ncbi:MAG: altronate dehydratase family protein, partial [Clostridiales bacterium]|nr:altronate dehydratase family protein [Clostridiales bacterium]
MPALFTPMNVVKINPADNVAVALKPIVSGEEIQIGGRVFTAKDNIGMGHKVAAAEIKSGEEAVKYGFPIGRASADISVGEHVHTHNVKTGLSGGEDYFYAPRFNAPAHRPSGAFKGFRRENGKVGVRNEIWVIPTVGCVNSVGSILAEKARRLARGSIGGVYGFTHPYGCSQLGDDHKNTQKALSGLIHHPNAGAVLVLGLGCEKNHIAGMKEMLGHGDTDRVKFLNCQDFEDEIAEGLSLLEKLAAYAGKFTREDVPMSALTVGLKCGGSDGFSGITANPLLGVFSDRLTAEGGTAILTEVPEMFGAETILLNRCADKSVFDKAVSMINGFKEYFIQNNQPVYENPSPGNKAGGITTLEDKSLGCTQKAG